MNDLILSTIKTAMGNTERFFDIEIADELVNDEDIYCVLVSIKPKPIDHPECRLINDTPFHAEFTIEKDTPDEVQMILGEDDPKDVTAASIYAAMYWTVVTEAA